MTAIRLLCRQRPFLAQGDIGSDRTYALAEQQHRLIAKRATRIERADVTLCRGQARAFCCQPRLEWRESTLARHTLTIATHQRRRQFSPFSMRPGEFDIPGYGSEFLGRHAQEDGYNRFSGLRGCSQQLLRNTR